MFDKRNCDANVSVLDLRQPSATNKFINWDPLRQVRLVS